MDKIEALKEKLGENHPLVKSAIEKINNGVLDKEVQFCKGTTALSKRQQRVYSYAKKSGVFKSIEKGASVPFVSNNVLFNGVNAEKSLSYGFKSDYVYPVINSTGWLDSHFDVHIKGCYKKTVKEQQGKVYLIDTHLKGLANIITRKDHVNMLVKDIDWSLLGKDGLGSTESLVFEINKANVRKDALEFMESTPDLENSFAMRYINVELAMKSNDSAFKEENEVFEEIVS